MIFGYLDESEKKEGRIITFNIKFPTTENQPVTKL